MLTRLAKLSFVAVIALSLSAIAAAQPSPLTVALGFDYLQTQPGSSFQLRSGNRSCELHGVPLTAALIPPGYQQSLAGTDTIVQRQADADINGNPIPIQLMALSVESTAPVNVGGSFFDVFVHARSGKSE